MKSLPPNAWSAGAYLHVMLPELKDAVGELVAHLCKRGAQPLHVFCAEGRVQQPAHLCVLGYVSLSCKTIPQPVLGDICKVCLAEKLLVAIDLGTVLGVALQGNKCTG